MSEAITPEPGRPSKEQLRRERELLLTTFDPSEFGYLSDSGAFTALAEHVRDGDESTVAPVRPDEEPTT